MSKLPKDESKKAGLLLSYALGLAVALAALVMLVLLLYIGTQDCAEIRKERKDSGVCEVQEYTCRNVLNQASPIGVDKEYTFFIGDTVENDTYLAFYAVHQYVEVKLEDTCVYRLLPTEISHPIMTVGCNWVMVPLGREDAGKQVCVTITPAYQSVLDREPEFLIGSGMKIYADRLMKDLPQLLLGAIAVFVGVVFLCIACYAFARKRQEYSMFFLGVFSIMLGLWRLTDTRFTPFLVPDQPVLMFYLSVSMLMLGMIPLIKAIQGNSSEKCQHVLKGYGILAAVICLVQLILQIFAGIDLREQLYLTHLVIGAGVLLILCCMVYDRLRNREGESAQKGRKLPLLCAVGVLADVVSYYVRGTSSGLIFTLMALIFYIVFSGVDMMFQYGQQEKRLARQERELAESRIATMISQIQPHFIYNTLGTIGYFCRTDPGKAQALVEEFSEYLRGNFTELDNSVPISIEKEMAHVQHYVNIEKVRFPDMTITYDLKARGFLLPALSVQPLVENAIKHGLMGLEEGGNVWISTYETEKEFCVCVKDDGVGFDPEKSPDDGRKHVGIQNIRERIRIMRQGTLTIESAPGEGTTALIRIPKESNEMM